MILWRLVKRKYATRERLLGGAGAKAVGGRWNRRGLAVVYASSTASLALLETLVHTDVHALPASLVAVQLIVPDDLKRTTIGTSQLPVNWREPEDEACVELGSRWIESLATPLLVVPSAVNPLETNVLLNPEHHQIERCSIGEITPVSYDPRLLRLFA